jgi:hypothetical protein
VDLLPPYTALATRQSPSPGEKLAAAAQSDGSAVVWIASGSVGLQIVQVGDAEAADNPALIRSKLGFGDVTDVALQGSYAYIADAGGRLSVANLSNPTNPSLTGTEETAGAATGVTGMTIGAASYALVADGSKGLSVVSTTNPSNPTQKATFDTPGWSSDVVPATLGGDPFACVADGESGLRLINLSPLGTPAVTVFSDDFEDGFEGWTTTGTVQSYTGAPRRGTHSVRLLQDGSMARTISTVGFASITVSYYLGATFTTTGAAVAAEWYDGSTWWPLTSIQKDDLDEDGALHPYSTELPATAGDNASLALRFVLSGSGTGDYAYLDDVMVKSSSGSDPFESGFYNTPGQARGVAVSGTLAYVADGEKGLRIIDIASPGHPQEVGSIDTAGYAESLRMLGNVAVVADGDNGLVLLDCSTPSDPAELAHYQTQGYASDVALATDHAYLLENGWGLTILELWYTFRDVLFSQWAFEEIEAAVKNGIVFGYDDGLYHPGIICSRDQMAVFIARAVAGGDEFVPEPPAGQETFKDIASGSDPNIKQNWAWKYIEYCADHDIVVGFTIGDDVYYRPLVTVTRDTMAVFMARSQGWVTIDEDMTTAPTLFPDVPEGFWAGTAIQQCIENEVVHGYDDGLYRPYVPVTRDQMAVFIYRTFHLSL